MTDQPQQPVDELLVKVTSVLAQTYGAEPGIYVETVAKQIVAALSPSPDTQQWRCINCKLVTRDPKPEECRECGGKVFAPVAASPDTREPTDAMIEAARDASDWAADLRDDEIAHIYLAMQAAQPGEGK